MYKHNSFII